jgi:catechol 2,3-dioxygenase-like lactoylglutathione lyase family enzyme
VTSAIEETPTQKDSPQSLFKRLDHFEVVPSDAARTLRFYQDALGFSLKGRHPVSNPPMKEVIFLTLGDTMLEIIDVEGPAPQHANPWHVGWRGLALEVADMAAALAYLGKKGILPSREPVDLGGSIRAEIEDPDGLMIELRQWK